MNSVSYWFAAIRPKTLSAAAGPVILGVSLAYFLAGEFNLPVALVTLLCALVLQVATNLVNDYYDGVRGTDTTERLGPTRVTSSGLIPAAKVRVAFILSFVISFVLGSYLMWIGGWPIIIIGLASIVFAYIYTGGPLPLSHYALGELLAFIFFGPVAVWGSYYLQTLHHHNLVLIAGAGPGLISAALMAINNLRDQKNDQLARKHTLAVMAGESVSRYLPVLFVLLSMIIPVIFFNIMKTPISVFIVCLTPFLFLSSWQRILFNPIDEQLNQSLADTGKYLFIYCFFFSFSLLIP